MPGAANTQPMVKSCGRLFILFRASCLILSVIFSLITHAQKQGTGNFSNISIGVQGYYGSFLINKSKAEYIRDSYMSLAEIFVQKQTTGSRHWERSHKLPQWGFSYIYGNTGSKKYIGNLHAVSAYIVAPIINTKKFQSGFRLGAGPGWSTNLLIFTAIQKIHLSVQSSMLISE